MEPPSGRTDVPGSMQSNDHRSDLNPGTVGSAHRVQCPPLSQVLSELASLPPASTLAATEPLPSEEQKKLFESLQKCLKAAENADISDALKETPDILQKLWKCRSPYLVPAAEAMANGSRAPLWRISYGKTGVFDFFLQLIASKETIDNRVILHALRLVGNSCADTNENRETVVEHNYTAAIVQHSSNPELIQVVIPVLYNICIDFGPAQTQLAADKIVYILLKLVKDGAFKDKDALLDYVFELIELQGIASSPDGTISLLVELALDEDVASTPARFSGLVSGLATYLNNTRFQEICISSYIVPDILGVLSRSLTFKTESSAEDTQALAQSRLKINQILAEISGSTSFAQYYPLDSPLAQSLKTWLKSTDDQLQICSCVILGNLARSDATCERMVQDLNIHEELITILKSDVRGAVLHSALGFLKNLAIAGNNRLVLGEAGILPAVSRLWQYESVPQVQFAATSIARQVIVAAVDNISRLLEGLPRDGTDSNDERTYLSLLLALFQKTDSTPIKTEIGRTVASICRTLVPKSREGDPTAVALLDRFFDLHEDIALPVGAMIAQSQWPVVRSEGWFAMALMASNKGGAMAVSSSLQRMEILPLLEKTLSAEASESAEETEQLQTKKDRDNISVLVQELLKSDPDTLAETDKSTMQQLMHSHVSRHLQDSKPTVNG
ncbi:putative GTP binding protein [Aspergillus tubingensis]|uniref:putative GTP binding protein n=1 Tax=Aspergillus tubingensis TaxID=5068 RepID=UPI001577A0BD|nr:GTP-binding protein [Aspergillus tubingensis]GFN10796.1 GTP-binding protein [Aspergillus tubingensis]